MRAALALLALVTVVGLGAGCAPDAPTASARTPGTPTDPRPAAVSSAPAAPATAAAIEPQAMATPVPVMARSVPVRVEVPSIGVDSGLMELGLRSDGTMEVPPEAFPAGWYNGAPTPGELGPAVIAGHIDWVTGPAVFADLSAVGVDDEVVVTRADGTRAVFRVTSVGQYDKDAFPTDLVYGDLDHAGLRLITCGGSWDAEAGHYRDNTVVFAELVAAG